MTAQRMKEIQSNIAELKEQRTKAQARMEQIEEDWKSTYGIKSVKEANAHSNTLQEELKGYDKRLEKLSVQIEEITDWDEVG